MARTVTVRLSVLAAVLLVSVGGTLYAVGTQEPRPEEPSVSGVSVSPAGSEDVAATNVSELPREQRGVFLLAVEPGDFGSYHTDDERIAAAMERLPDHVRYEDTVYDVTEASGHADTVSLPLKEWAGMGIAAIGVLVLFVAHRRSLERESGGDGE